MKLQLDLGNTRIKARRGEAAPQSFEYADLPRLIDSQVSRVEVSSVRDAQFTNSVLKHLGMASGNQYYLAVVGDELSCEYENPQRLGVDRWLAALAVSQKHRRCVVVDAGTAITIDLLDAGFRGGLICLGMQKCVDTLMSNTDKINADPDAAKRVIPTNTNVAVSAGALYQAIGAVEAFHRDHAADSAIICTGGDGALIAAHMHGAIYEPNLVLEGLNYCSFEQKTCD